MRTLTLRVRESFGFLPAVAGVLAIVAAELLVLADRTVQDTGIRIAFLDQLSASGGRSILTTIGTAMLTVAGTSFSITISVLATTSSTYGPRLVRNFMADRANAGTWTTPSPPSNATWTQRSRRALRAHRG